MTKYDEKITKIGLRANILKRTKLLVGMFYVHQTEKVSSDTHWDSFQFLENDYKIW